VSLADRLRRLTESLPAGGSVTLTRDALGELLAEADEPSVDLTVRQVARLLAVSESAVRRLLEAQHLRGYKAGATWCVPPGSLADFRAEQEKGRPTLRPVAVRRRLPA
jgi:excisionase family DNA binding protein